MTDVELAVEIARAAGALLLDLQRGGGDGKALGDTGDARANALILAMLADARPGDAVLSEERVCDGARLAEQRVWVVDPLDGTREFGEGRDDWAVHIGLAVNGVAVTGAVALPALNECWSSTLAAPAPPPHRAPIMVVSRSRPPAEALRVAEALGTTLLPMGSAGAKAMAVVRGTADIYVHAGGQYEWDNCAPVAVAVAHGLHASRIDGTPLTYNRADPYLPDLLICRAELAASVLAALDL